MARVREKRISSFDGYIKVELASRHPRRWAWSIYNDGAVLPLAMSETPYFCAEDAWAAGRRAIADLEQGVGLKKSA